MKQYTKEDIERIHANTKKSLLQTIEQLSGSKYHQKIAGDLLDAFIMQAQRECDILEEE